VQGCDGGPESVQYIRLALECPSLNFKKCTSC